MRVYKERINRLFFCHTASDNQYYVNLCRYNIYVRFWSNFFKIIEHFFKIIF